MIWSGLCITCEGWMETFRKYRSELVGKRFLSVGSGPGRGANASPRAPDLPWKAGVIRAATHKHNKNKDLQVLNFGQFSSRRSRPRGLNRSRLFSRGSFHSNLATGFVVRASWKGRAWTMDFGRFSTLFRYVSPFRTLLCVNFKFLRERRRKFRKIGRFNFAIGMFSTRSYFIAFDVDFKF